MDCLYDNRHLILVRFNVFLISFIFFFHFADLVFPDFLLVYNADKNFYSFRLMHLDATVVLIILLS